MATKADSGSRARAPGKARGPSKRDQVMQAAKTVFLEQGYGTSSMDAIAEEAGVSKATVYAYFESKDVLFEAMVAEYCEEQRQAIEALEADHATAEEGLYRMAQIMMRYWSQPGALQFSRMIYGESRRFPETGRSFVKTGVLSLQKIVAEFLQEANKRRELRVPNPEIAAEIFISMTRGPVQLRSLTALGKPPSAEPLNKIAREAARMIVATYRP